MRKKTNLILTISIVLWIVGLSFTNFKVLLIPGIILLIISIVGIIYWIKYAEFSDFKNIKLKHPDFFFSKRGNIIKLSFLGTIGTMSYLQISLYRYIPISIYYNFDIFFLQPLLLSLFFLYYLFKSLND